MTYREIVTQILDIIEYQDDKSDFIAQFFVSAQLETINSLAATLPEQQQKQLDNALGASGQSPEQFAIVMHKFFNVEQIKQSSDQTYIREIGGLLDSLKDDLTESQKVQLAQMLQQLESEPAPAN